MSKKYGESPKGYVIDKSSLPLKVGDTVVDQLTFDIVKIIEIAPIPDIKNVKGEVVVHQSWKGNWYKINHDYLRGWRFDWEIERVKPKRK